ncbi:MAG: TraR/DksA family transcriptional regulator [Burkholderiaceae bacterium]
MSTLTPEQREHLERRMQDRALALRNEMRGEAEREDDYPDVATDIADSGQASFADLWVDVGNAEVTRDLREMRAIAAAMTRIDDGTYGDCADCGKDIPYARLEAQPTAERCVPCQERYEKTHADPLRGGTM